MIHDVQLEMACLGSMILDSNAARSVLSQLQPEDFWKPANQTIFRAFQASLKAKKPLDDFLVLKTAIGDLESIGGEDYLLEIAQYVPSPANADDYAASVKELSLRRTMIEASRRLAAMASDPEQSLDACRLVAAEAAAMEVRQAPVVRLSDVQPTRSDEGVSTGYPGLDKLIGTAGYPKGQTTVVAAYQKSGKTALMLGSTLAAAKAGHRLCYATFADLNPTRLKRRMNRAEYGSSNPDKSLLDPFDFDSCLAYDGTRSGDWRTVEAFCDWFRLEHRKRPFDIAFVDYAQRLENRGRPMPIFEHTRHVSRSLATLAEETGVPVVVGSQIQLGGKDGLDRTKGGTSLEEDAGWVIRIRKDEKAEHYRSEWFYADIESAYSRFGPMGVAVRTEFNPQRLQFQELAA